MIRPRPRRCRGSAMITVTVIGLFVMLLAASLVNHYAVSEARAVVESLAKLRAYWATMGHINYVLSRTYREGLCGGAGCANDADRAVTLNNFLDEIDNTGADQRNWVYPNYTLNLVWTVADTVGSRNMLWRSWL